jgi:hypothetical protein
MRALFLLLLPTAALAQPVELTEKQQRYIASEIQFRGFACPSIVSAGKRGDDHYGTVLRVRCGTGSQFKVTVRPSGGVLISPWTECKWWDPSC